MIPFSLPNYAFSLMQQVEVIPAYSGLISSAQPSNNHILHMNNRTFPV